MSEFGKLWLHTHTQDAPWRQNNLLNECCHSTERRRMCLVEARCIFVRKKKKHFQHFFFFFLRSPFFLTDGETVSKVRKIFAVSVYLLSALTLILHTDFLSASLLSKPDRFFSSFSSSFSSSSSSFREAT